MTKHKNPYKQFRDHIALLRSAAQKTLPKHLLDRFEPHIATIAIRYETLMSQIQDALPEDLCRDIARCVPLIDITQRNFVPRKLRIRLKARGLHFPAMPLGDIPDLRLPQSVMDDLESHLAALTGEYEKAKDDLRMLDFYVHEDASRRYHGIRAEFEATWKDFALQRWPDIEKHYDLDYVPRNAWRFS